MKNEEKDLLPRTKMFARRVIVSEKRLHPLVAEANELVAVFITIFKRARGHE
jgi:hypothetical protein